MQKLFVVLIPAALFLAITPAVAQVFECTDNSVTHGGETFACDDVDLLAHVSLEQMSAGSGNDSWGWTDRMLGREYALMGLNNGTFFVDITNPLFPRLLGKLPTATSSSQWRDMKVFQHYMVVVSEAGGHGMQIFDLTQLRDLDPDPSRTFTADVTFTGPAGNTLGSAHNVAVNEDTGFAYVVGARNQSGSYACSGGLYMVDINDPLNPSFAGCFSQDGYTHDVQCVIYDGPDSQYQGNEICLASNENTVTIVDVTNKSNPVMISQALYPEAGYTHQGWLTDNHRYFFVNDEIGAANRGRTIVLDVTSLTNPTYIGSRFQQPASIMHNLFIRGQRLYAANYTTGLRILDIEAFTGAASPGSPVNQISEVGYFDTHPPHSDPVFQGAWSTYPFFPSGNVVISDINRGLFVVRPPALPEPPVSGEGVPDSAIGSIEVFPNPFSDRFTMSLSLQHDQSVRVEVFDVLGRRVAQLFDGPMGAGEREITHDLSDQPAGIFVVRVTGDDFAISKRITRLR